MTALFLQYPPCSTCRKAFKWLTEHSVEVKTRHIVEDRPTASELTQWIARSGLPVRKFFNTSGRLYKEKNLKEALPGMTEAQQIELLASDGMLVKRPLLILEDRIAVGFRSGQYEELL